MVSANPTGPIVVSAARNGAYGDSVARLLAFGGHHVSREYYYNDAGAQMERFRASVDALRRGETVPEDGYQGDYVAALAARAKATRCRRCSQSIERDDGALPRPLRLVGAAERARGAARRAPAAARHVRGATARVWARSSAYGDDAGLGARAVGRAGRDADVPGGRRCVPRRQARARLRPRDLRARRRPPRRRQVVRGDRAHARLRPGARRGAALPARAPDARRRADEDVEARAATSSSSTTSWTRSASTLRAGISSTAGRTRRSRSTSTSRPRSRRRTRCTTCSTRTRASRRSCATPADATVGGDPPGALAAEEKELIKRLTDFPATVREAAERRGPAAAPGVRDPAGRRLPPLLPRVPRPRRSRRVVPPRPLPRDAAGDRPQPRPASASRLPSGCSAPSRSDRPYDASVTTPHQTATSRSSSSA